MVARSEQVSRGKTMTDYGTTDPFLYYLIVCNLALSAYGVKLSISNNKTMTKVKTALMMKFADLREILK